MPAEQLLSTDPKAGVVLSTDPRAGMAMPASGTHPEAAMRAPRATEPVTLGELVDNPAEAIGRIGTILKRDVTDPKTWMQAAAMYFGPKVLNAVMPGFANATLSAMKSGGQAAMRPVRAAVNSGVSPDVVGIYSPRIANAMRAAQQIRAAMPAAEAPAAAPAGTAPPVTSVPAAPPIVAPAAPEAVPAPIQAPTRIVTPIAKFNPSEAMTSVRASFDALQMKPRGGEVTNAMEFVRRGFTADEAVGKVLAKRPSAPTLSAAEQLAKKWATPSDAEVTSTVQAKNAQTTRAKGGTKNILTRLATEDKGTLDLEALTRRFRPVKPGETVDGRTVGQRLPNQSSIESSLDDWEEVPGIREVSMADFADPDYTPKPYSVAEAKRLDKLQADIAQSKHIEPLIVVFDKEQHPYILEGGHRFDALHRLGAKSFPAKIIIDRSK